jgi:hypothetical protein
LAPVIHDIAGPLLESSRLDQEPPSLVRHAQEAVRWLSTSNACVDEDSREASAAFADTLAHLLVVYMFADAARTRSESRGVALEPRAAYATPQHGLPSAGSVVFLVVANCETNPAIWGRPCFGAATGVRFRSPLARSSGQSQPAWARRGGFGLSS